MDRIGESLDRLFVQSRGEINSRIEQISLCVDISETQAKEYCYCLKVDANGNLRLKDLIDLLILKSLSMLSLRKKSMKLNNTLMTQVRPQK